MDNQFNQNTRNELIDDFIKTYNSNNFSLKILKRHIKNSYYLLIEIKPRDCSMNEAIKSRKLKLHLIKFDGMHVPEAKLCSYLDKSLEKCKKGKISNNIVEKLYLRLNFSSIYKKYFGFDETIIVLIILIILFLIGVIWSSYHNIITDYMLTH